MPAILIVSSLVQFFGGSLTYVRDTIKGRSKPNRMTYLIWSIGPLIAVAAGLAAGGSWALLPVFMAGFGPLCIFLASFVNPNAYWRLRWFDYGCGALAILALVLWRITDDPIIAIIFAIGADALALIPTAIKSWRFPETETGIAYILAFLNVCVGIAISSHSQSEILFLSYLFIADLTCVIAIYRMRLVRFLVKSDPNI